MGRVETDKYQPWVPKSPPSDLFPFAYTFKCIVPGINVVDETEQAKKYLANLVVEK